MKTIFEILSVLLALVALGSASLDFRGAASVKELMRRLQYRDGFERFLGVCKVLGAVGLLIGLGAHGLGVAAAIGFVIYFALAVRAHLSIGDEPAGLAPAVGLLILSLLTAGAGVAS